MCRKSVSELISVESLKRKTEKLENKSEQYEHQQNATNETLIFNMWEELLKLERYYDLSYPLLLSPLF